VLDQEKRAANAVDATCDKAYDAEQTLMKDENSKKYISDPLSPMTRLDFFNRIRDRLNGENGIPSGSHPIASRLGTKADISLPMAAY